MGEEDAAHLWILVLSFVHDGLKMKMRIKFKLVFWLFKSSYIFVLLIGMKVEGKIFFLAIVFARPLLLYPLLPS